ncbi:MAG: sulfatase-like hydrolase/transferase [Massilibacteroides sp.]|nr:sulfatase-like hydrolase/transferase [Massilibacteroides sp.]
MNLLILGGIFLPTILSKAYSQEQNRPNILWIVSEDNTVLLNTYGDSHAKTPNIDALAKEGTVYEHTYGVSSVSAADRSTLITGMYSPCLGIQHMRSTYPLPDFLHFYTEYIREAGYYCVNNWKEDFNTNYPSHKAWDETGKSAKSYYTNLCPEEERTEEGRALLKKSRWENRKPGQPFFQIYNIMRTHESRLFLHPDSMTISPNDVEIPPYIPDLPEERYDKALYYYRLEQMDKMLGVIVDRLKEEGLYENTIIFYYADNGGVLARSKRFYYENSLHVPLVIRFPKKYQYLAPTKPGGREERLVSFVDFAPTMLSLLNIPIPAYMQGKPFLGEKMAAKRKYVYAFCDRIGERIDMTRALRGERFKYIRNYMPQRPNGQHGCYMWEALGYQAWEKAWKEGKCNEVQSRFWLPKPAEEFYDLQTDPYEIHNLANNPFFQNELDRFRKKYKEYELKMKDLSFLPEGMMVRRSAGKAPYSITHDPAFPYTELYDTADKASLGKAEDFDLMKERLTHQEASIRYWALMGCALRPSQAKSIQAQIEAMAQTDVDPDVRIGAAEVLNAMGETKLAVDYLLEVVKNYEAEFVRLHAFNVVDVIGESADPIRKYAIENYAETHRTKGNDVTIIKYWKGVDPGFAPFYKN